MTSAARVERFQVAAGEAGERLDRWLAARASHLSRTRIQELIAEGRVRVNGAAVKRSHAVAGGDIVEVSAVPRPATLATPEAIPLEVLYEDDEVVVVNKPAGMTVHAGAGKAAAGGTLVNALLHRYRRLGSAADSETAALRPGIVHRLDKETSGAVVVARTDAAHANLGEQFRLRQVRKTYLALVHGSLRGDAGVIDLPVARDLKRRTRMTTRRRIGRAADTRWRALLRFGGEPRSRAAAYTLAEVDLRTGRTHQIRVHFSAVGHPVVGDTLYGAPAQPRVGNQVLPSLRRNFLHAACICFLHPENGRPVEVRAPLPQELRGWLEHLTTAAGGDSLVVDAALRPFL